VDKICVIPARGGSKRIPKKNIKDFLGTPAICQTIQMLLHAEIFTRIIVSTDSEEISSLAVQAGAHSIVMRTDELSNDFVPTKPVVAHSILQSKISMLTDSVVCCVYPVNPFLDITKLKEGFEALISHDQIDFVCPVTTYP
jgi:CMP-N-acetylneuraminic acid synthetase